MIITRYGREVKIIHGDLSTGDVEIQYLDDGSTLKTYIYELRADHGLSEIADAIMESEL